MNKDLSVLTDLCIHKGISFEQADLDRLSWLSRILEVQLDEMISMIALEILSDKNPPSLKTIISRVHKRIVREYEKRRRSYEKAVDAPIVTQEELLDLKQNVERLSLPIASVIESALDGKTVADIVKETGMHPRTVYRRLKLGVQLLRKMGTRYLDPGELDGPGIVDYQDSGFSVFAHPPASVTGYAGSYFPFSLINDERLRIGKNEYLISKCSFMVNPPPG